MSRLPESVAVDLLSAGKAYFTFRSNDLTPFIIRGFERLIKEPEAVRERWLIDREGNGDPDDGLIERHGERKPGSGEAYDRKFFFHFKRHLPSLLWSRGVKLEPYGAWLHSLTTLHNRCLMFMSNLAPALDRLLPGHRFTEHVRSERARDMHCLRLLWYLRPNDSQNNQTAAAHVDRDFLTIHVADSRPGLYLRNRDGWSPSPYVAGPNHALLFPGAKATHFTSDLPMQWHEVRDAGGAQAEPRWAIVFFCHTDTPLAEMVQESCRATALGKV